ncbi:hypothetical protein [Promicromonospora umidemergens]|uniref:MAPEG family protein n=1 Tax=Promicromonospora umidemergens TaxID=629679 RepID=A0ABP8XNN7_9MICO|nr:hypothetical protein [Promicromonospora umidemergens]
MTWEMLENIDGWRWVAAVAIWLVTLLLSVVVGSWVVPWVLRRASGGDLPWARYEPPILPQALESGDDGGVSLPGESGDGGEPPSGTMNPHAMAILRGGAWLGLLERLAITGALLAGYPYGIAVVVAIKGLGRYAELRDQPIASERFVVGTLASLIWSVAMGLLGLVAINALVV